MRDMFDVFSLFPDHVHNQVCRWSGRFDRRGHAFVDRISDRNGRRRRSAGSHLRSWACIWATGIRDLHGDDTGNQPLSHQPHAPPGNAGAPLNEMNLLRTLNMLSHHGPKMIRFLVS